MAVALFCAVVSAVCTEVNYRRGKLNRTIYGLFAVTFNLFAFVMTRHY